MKNLKLKLVFCALLFSSLCSAQWEHLNFVDGGYAGEITRDSGGYIFVSSGHSGQIYRSTNAGITWINFTNGFPHSTVYSFLSTNSAIYAATNGAGVYKTTNHGLSWFQLNNGITTNYSESFAMNNQYIFVGTHNGVYRSSNGSSNWEFANSGIGSTHGVHDMLVKDSSIFAVTSIGATGYMYKSTNNGLNWVLINNGLPSFHLEKLAKCGNKIFASGSAAGLYVTSNNGENWNQITLPGSNTSCSISSKGDTLIVSLYSNKFMITTNGGISWNTITSNLPTYSVLTKIIYLPQYIIGIGDGIYKSTNLGLNWQNSISGFDDYDIQKITARNNIVIVQIYNAKVLRSTNYGVSWSETESLIAFYPKFQWVGTTLYANNDHIMRSTDFGQTFLQLGTEPSGGIYSFAIHNNIFLACGSDKIYRSTNSCYSWTQITAGLPTYVFSVGDIFNRDSICFVGVQRGGYPSSTTLFRSTNFGISWDSIPNTSAFAPASIITYNSNDNKFYMGAYDGVYTSTNLGNNWFPNNNGFPTSRDVNSLFFNGDTIYASIIGGGIYRSSIQSHIWSPYNEGLLNLNVNEIYASNDYLYAAVKYGGFFRRRANISVSVKNNYEVCKDYELFQNYPNPFNATTSIKYQVESIKQIKLVVFDILGKEVTTPVNERQGAGTYEINFDGSNLASGIYFYKLTAGEFTQTRKMVLIK